MNNYEKIRDTIQTGDLFFTKSRALFSRLIRFFTQSDVSHVGVFFWQANRLLCCEMLEDKNCIITAASIRLWDSPFDIGKLSEKNATDEEIISFCWDSAWRKKYSKLRAFISYFKKADTKKTQQDCSEFACECTKQKFYALNRWIFPIDLVAKCRLFISVK